MFIIGTDGSIVASPVSLRDTTEGALTMASDGSIYIPHGAMESSIAHSVIPLLPEPLKRALLEQVVPPIGGVSALEPVSFLDLAISGIDWVQDLDAAALSNLDLGEINEAYTQVRRGTVQLGATTNSIVDAEERGEIDLKSSLQARLCIYKARKLLDKAKSIINLLREKPGDGLLRYAQKLIENTENQLENALSILEGLEAPLSLETKELKYSESMSEKGGMPPTHHAGKLKVFKR